MCGIDGQKTKDGRCMVICPTSLGDSIALPQRYICNGERDCDNGVDEANCDFYGSERCTLDSSIIVPKETLEKVTCDESYFYCGGGFHYYDEKNCDHTTGISTEFSKPSWVEGDWWLHPYFTCLGSHSMFWNQSGCEAPKGDPQPGQGIRCAGKDNKEVYIPPFNMCTNPYINAPENTEEYHPCLHWEEQMNCQAGRQNIALSCNVKEKATNITKYLICGRGQNCDDAIDEKCENFTTADGKICRIHEHQICDGVKDCAFGVDETGCHTELFQEVLCQRRVNFSESVAKPLPILKRLVMDGQKDCINGEDESDDVFQECGRENRTRNETRATKCNEMFKVSKIAGDPEYLSMDLLCDHASHFPEEKKMCFISREYHELWKKNILYAGKAFLPPCLPDLLKYNRALLNCKETSFDVIGKKSALHFIYSRTKQQCSYLFGEAYLFASCNDLCIEKNAVCMDQNGNIPKCLNNDFETVNTLMRDRSTNAIQLVKASLGIQRNRSELEQSFELVTDVFSCKNGRCIKKDEVCNLADDCGDGSDEDLCVNQFRCKASNERLTLEKQCNGIVNCVDFSDECGDDCVSTQKRIISSNHLRNAAWVIGMGSTVINILVLIKSVVKLGRMQEISVVFRDNFLIMLIAFGDLLVGVYLLLIAIADFLKGEGYCKDQFNWRGGPECFYLGIISSIGSQISLFTMTVLSLYRIHRIRHLFESSILSRKRQILTALACLLILAISVLISVIPVMVQMEDFFINGLSYERMTLFVGMINKPVHTDVIKQYQGQMRIQFKNGLPSMSWKTIRRFIGDMFSKDHGGVEGKGTGFYGNSGVCLFKYFVTDDDPQRIYSLSILFLNFFCFIVITVSYILVLIVSRSNSNARHVAQMNTALQRKISLIILSDACCWIPFIVIGLLHFGRQIDASPLYDLCSIVVLPVNSLINPIIYHSEFNEYVRVTKGILNRIQRRARLVLRLDLVCEGRKSSNNKDIPTPETAETSNTKATYLSGEESSCKTERISLKTFIIKQTRDLENRDELSDSAPCRRRHLNLDSIELDSLSTS